jgi:hypothetical protein
MPKFGLECEGEFQGMLTVFCTVNEFYQLTRKELPGAVKQMYISDHENVLDLTDPVLSEMDCNGVRVTVERTSFDSAPWWVNIMLVVDSASFWNLRNQDQVKFTKDLNVYSIQKKSMVYTPPTEFKSDITFDISDLPDEKEPLL